MTTKHKQNYERRYCVFIEPSFDQWKRGCFFSMCHSQSPLPVARQKLQGPVKREREERETHAHAERERERGSEGANHDKPEREKRKAAKSAKFSVDATATAGR